MKFRTIFRFEFAYLVRRITTWLNLAVLLLFTLVMNLLTTPGDGVYANNTFHITAMTVIGGLIWLLMGGSIAGEAAARDVQSRMHPLTYTSPVTKLDYLGGRFLAAFTVNALLILSLPLGVMLSFYLPGINEGELLPFRPWAYLNVYLLIALPNAFIATAFQFSFAARSRQVMTSYMASLLLAIVAQIVAVAVAKLAGNWDLAKLLDPVGIAGVVSSEMATWTPVEKNTRLIVLEGMFLWNRILWLGVAAGLLLFTYQRFSLTNPAGKSWWSGLKRGRKAQLDIPAEKVLSRSSAISVPQVQRKFNFATRIRQALRIGTTSFGRIARNPVGLTLVAAVAIVSVAFADQIMSQFGIPLLPTSQQVLDYLANPVSNIGTPWVVIPLLIIYFAGELVWAERDAGLSDIADAAPVPECVLFTGRFLGLALIILAWLAILIAGGIAIQLSLGYDKLEPVLYLQTLFGLQFAEYLLFALLALAVHVIVNQKYIAYLVMLLVFSFTAFPSLFRVEHHMLVFGAGPGWSYTDMRGFGTTLRPWLWFKLYWAAWALLLALAASLLWARGREQGLKYRLSSAKHRFSGGTSWLATIATALILIVGSFVFYNTNILNEYQSGSDINEQKAEYERLYGRYRNRPQPQLTSTKLQVEIYPDRQQADIHAVYTLVNQDSVPIDSIHIGSLSGTEPVDIRFNRPAAAVLSDKKLSHYIYALKQSLQPGDTLQLSFALHYEQRGFTNSGGNALVVENGTSFTNYDLMPAIGYQRQRELNDPVSRKKYKLAARSALPLLDDPEARKRPFSTDQTSFEAIVGTSANEVAVAPGVLLRTWIRSTGSGQVPARRYFHYKTDIPIGGEYVILSANYALRESSWTNPGSSGQVVSIRIYYHPGHSGNVDRMLRSAKASLEYFTAHFGPYPYGQMTIVERAGDGGGASADAGMINYGETYSLMNPDDSPEGFELPYYILAHEIAHQWWGLARLTPANVEGAGVLIEGLAVYSGMQVLEKTYGDAHLRNYIDYLHSSYDMPRSLATPSLIRANEPFLYYRKGGLAMYALSKYVGKEKLNGALRRLLAKHDSGELPLPTTLDLYREIEKVTPDSLNYLLNDLFKQNTYWRLRTKQMAAEQTKADKWQVTIKVEAQKVTVDSAGREKIVPMNDWLEIGLYEDGKSINQPLYLQKHRIRSGEQIIKVTVPRKPARGGIDPNNLMIDIRRDDNVMEME